MFAVWFCLFVVVVMFSCKDGFLKNFILLLFQKSGNILKETKLKKNRKIRPRRKLRRRKGNFWYEIKKNHKTENRVIRLKWNLFRFFDSSVGLWINCMCCFCYLLLLFDILVISLACLFFFPNLKHVFFACLIYVQFALKFNLQKLYLLL